MAVAADICAVQFGSFDFDPLLWSKRAAYSPDYRLFRPFTVKDPLPADAPLWSGGAGVDAEVAPIPKIVASDGVTAVEVVHWRPRDIAFAIEAPAPGTAVAAQLYYPGWQAISVTTGRVLPTRPTDGRSLVAIDYGAGADTIRLRLAPQPPRSSSSLSRSGWGGSADTLVRKAAAASSDERPRPASDRPMRAILPAGGRGMDAA